MQHQRQAGSWQGWHWFLTALFTLASESALAGFSSNEVHIQRGSLDAPSFAGGQSSDTTIVTLQHASADAASHRFFFVDFFRDNRRDGFNDEAVYAEFYATLSLSHVLSRPLNWGLLKDVGLEFGVNYGTDAKVVKYLPGLRVALDLPGFAFAALEFNAYIDDSAGLSGGGAPAQSDSWHINFAWARPIEIGQQRFSIDGHVEYISSRRNELGQAVSGWLLAQPQFRWDLGHAVGLASGHWFIGVEWQVWMNKLGDPATDENAAQALLVWRF